MKSKHIVALACVLMLGLSVLGFSLWSQMVHAATSCTAAGCAQPVTKTTVKPTAKATVKVAVVPPRAVLSVQGIRVINGSGIAMNFSIGVLNIVGRPSYSGRATIYVKNQSKLLDASGLDLITGTTIFPYVASLAGRTVDGSAVRYAHNGKVATYTVLGTPANFTVTLNS